MTNVHHTNKSNIFKWQFNQYIKQSIQEVKKSFEEGDDDSLQNYNKICKRIVKQNKKSVHTSSLHYNTTLQCLYREI